MNAGALLRERNRQTDCESGDGREAVVGGIAAQRERSADSER